MTRQTGEDDLWTAPAPVLVACAVTGATLAGGAPLGVVALFGAIAYGIAAAVRYARLEGRRQARPLATTAPMAATSQRHVTGGHLWLELELEADRALARYDEAIASCRKGPLRDRLKDLRRDVVAGRDQVHAHVVVGLELQRQLGRSVPKKRRRDLQQRRDALLEEVQAVDAELGRAAILAFELAAESRDRRPGRADGPVAELEALQTSLQELRAVEG